MFSDMMPVARSDGLSRVFPAASAPAQILVRRV